MKQLVDASGKTTGIEFESKEELEAFQQLVDQFSEIGRRLRSEQQARAQSILDVLKAGEVKVDMEDAAGSAETSVREWQNQLNEAIRRNLDHRSIGAFIEIILKNRQAARAAMRHAEHHDMRRDVFRWLDEHMPKYASMDAAANDIAGKVVPVKWRTARDWVSLWKKERSAGRV